MLEFPSTTAVNRILPKDKFVEHLDLTPNLKKKLISDVVHIKILNKFSGLVLNFIEYSRQNPHRTAGFASSPFSNFVTASPQRGAALYKKDAPQKQSFGGAGERSETEGATHEVSGEGVLSLEEKISEVLLLQIDLKKPDFDSKLVEAIAKQNPHKLVFLLRYLQYAKLAVYYKKLYVGSWRPFEEVSLTLNGNNMNEVWLSFVGQVAVRDVVGGNCRQQSSCQNRHCEEHSDEAIQTPFGKGGCQVEPDRGILNSNNSKTSLSAKADISPYKGEYNGVITKSQLDHQLDLQNKAEAIKKEIVKLESAIRKERQPKRKFEMHKKLLELKGSLESLLDFRG